MAIKNKREIITISIVCCLSYISFNFMYDRHIFIFHSTRQEIDFINLLYRIYPTKMYIDNLYILPLIIAMILIYYYIFNYELDINKEKIRFYLDNKYIKLFFRCILVFAIIYIIVFITTGIIL